MAKAMWIAVLTYFGLIAIAPPVIAQESGINWIDTDFTTGLTDEDEWFLFHLDATLEYMDEFDRLFDAVEFKVSKNGRSMVKSANGGSFKFAKKG